MVIAAAHSVLCEQSRASVMSQHVDLPFCHTSSMDEHSLLCVSVTTAEDGLADEFSEDLLPFLRLLVDDARSSASG